MRSTLTVEALLTSPAAFGLTTATPVQRAICRIADGLPLGDLGEREDVRRAIGAPAALPGVAPAELLVLSGIRTGKSLFAAVLATRASQLCDLSRLGAGETARVSIVSTRKDVAGVVYEHVVGNFTARPALRALMVGEPTSDSVLVRHPSGRTVEIKVVAGARAGSTLVARWSAGVIFDEAPRMNGADDGVVNLDHARAAVIGRLLPGAQIVDIGSPWAPSGPVYRLFNEHFGKPSPRLVVVRAKAPDLNPDWWTPARCANLAATDPDAYRTDVEADFLDPEEALIPSSSLDACTRPGPLELGRVPGAQHLAAMDPGMRSNAWTLIIAAVERRPDGAPFLRVVCAREWKGSRTSPLSPAAVLADVAARCRTYGVEEVVSDQFSVDAIRDLAARVRLGIVEHTLTATTKVEAFERMRSLIAQGAIELPPDPTLRRDLLGLRKRVAQTGGFQIVLPKTGDGRHADFAACLALLAARGAPSQAPAEYDAELDAMLPTRRFAGAAERGGWCGPAAESALRWPDGSVTPWGASSRALRGW